MVKMTIDIKKKEAVEWDGKLPVIVTNVFEEDTLLILNACAEETVNRMPLEERSNRQVVLVPLHEGHIRDAFVSGISDPMIYRDVVAYIECGEYIVQPNYALRLEEVTG